MKLAQSFTNPKIRLSFWYASGHCCIFSADHSLQMLELLCIHSRWLNIDLWLKHLETTPARLLVALVWVVRTTRNSSISSWNLPFPISFRIPSHLRFQELGFIYHPCAPWRVMKSRKSKFWKPSKRVSRSSKHSSTSDTHRMHCIWGYVSNLCHGSCSDCGVFWSKPRNSSGTAVSLFLEQKRWTTSYQSPRLPSTWYLI